MDISTSYMGLKLKNPIIVSSSKLTSTIENVKKCVDHGAGAVVLKSLFEEQLLADVEKLETYDHKYFWFPEAVDYINDFSKGKGVKEYVNLIKECKAYTDIPVIASINCITAKEWPKFATKLEEAGIDGLELNISIFPFDENVSSKEIEDKYVDIVQEVKKYVKVPVAVKIGPCFSNHVQIAKRLIDAGADGLVIFNRYFRPDIDVEKEIIERENYLSAPEELTQSLRWVSVIKNKINCQIAAGTGIHCANGMIKQLLAGADATQICSVLYKNGIGFIDNMLEGLKEWMEKKDYNSIEDFKGKVIKYAENIAEFQRVQFMKRTIE